jgi:transcriptional regulator with XRE-family HTH domain
MGTKKKAAPAGAKLLVTWRTRRNYRQDDVADLIGCKKSHVCHAEKGRRRLSLRLALALETASAGYVPASAWA